MKRIVIIAAAAALLAGCGTLKGQFVNEVSCADESKRMTFTSWWFEWLGISARVANGAQHCAPSSPGSCVRASARGRSGRCWS